MRIERSGHTGFYERVRTAFRETSFVEELRNFEVTAHVQIGEVNARTGLRRPVPAEDRRIG